MDDDWTSLRNRLGVHLSTVGPGECLWLELFYLQTAILNKLEHLNTAPPTEGIVLNDKET